MTKVFDKFGRNSNEVDFKGADKVPYQVDSATTGTVYLRYDNNDKSLIRRIVTADNMTTFTFGYGAWSSRAGLTYSPIAETLTVED